MRMNYDLSFKIVPPLDTCTGISKVRLFFSGQVPRGEDIIFVHIIHSDKWTSVHTQRIVGVRF